MLFLSSFNIQSLWPLCLLLCISAAVPVIHSVFRMKKTPSLVLEILAGIILAVIPMTNHLFAHDYHLIPMYQGLYTIGMGILLFMSGLEVDFSVFNDEHKIGNRSFPVVKFSLISFLIVLILSLLSSFAFIHEVEGNKIIGILLIVVFLSSTFASIVVPLTHAAHIGHSTLGKIIGTYATLAEFFSILSLSVILLFVNNLGSNFRISLFLSLILFIVIILVNLLVPLRKLFHAKTGGMNQIRTRVLLFIILLSILIFDLGGVEYILGPFLLGMLVKGLYEAEEVNHKMEIVGYGLFIPLFYILVGFSVGLLIDKIGVKEFLSPSFYLLFIGMIVLIILVKLPFAYLCKYYTKRTVVETLLFMTPTVIVPIAIEHISDQVKIFSDRFLVIMIIVSMLSVIIPPILFANFPHFDRPKQHTGTGYIHEEL